MKKSLLVAALGLALLAPGAAKAEVIERVVATINDDAIFLSELRRRSAPGADTSGWGVAAAGSIPGALAGAALGLVGGALTGRYAGSSYARAAIDTTSADAVIPHWSLAGPGLIRRGHKEGKNVLTYTVNKPITARALKLFGADGVVTDAPVEMQKIYP